MNDAPYAGTSHFQMLTDESAIVPLSFSDVDEPNANLSVALTALPGLGVEIEPETGPHANTALSSSQLPYVLPRGGLARVRVRSGGATGNTTLSFTVTDSKGVTSAGALFVVVADESDSTGALVSGPTPSYWGAPPTESMPGHACLRAASLFYRHGVTFHFRLMPQLRLCLAPRNSALPNRDDLSFLIGPQIAIIVVLTTVIGIALIVLGVRVGIFLRAAIIAKKKLEAERDARCRKAVDAAQVVACHRRVLGRVGQGSPCALRTRGVSSSVIAHL